MRIDLHVHTSKYSGCGQNTGREMTRAAVEAGLDGLVFTDHDTYQTEEEIRILREEFPELLILNAIELSLPEGHLLIYGPDRLPRRGENWTMREAAEFVEKEEGFCVVAHPFRYERTPEHFAMLSEIPFHGVETVSNNTDEGGSIMAVELAESRGLVKIGASDAHEIRIVGLYHTLFEDEIRSMEDMVRALRAGRVRPSPHTILSRC